MKEESTKVGNYFRKTDERLMQVNEDLAKCTNTQQDQKFDIDKLFSTTNSHTSRLNTAEEKIAKLLTDCVDLRETKTDLTIYHAEIKQMNETIKKTVETALTSEALTKNMIDFIHKYEPIYVQRQIS